MQAKRRGTLKVWLGLAAGVSKTYRMLQEAADLHAPGVEVLILPARGRSQPPQASRGRCATAAQCGEEVFYRLAMQKLVSFNEARQKLEFVGQIVT
ncbi:MAG: hypothetical protein EOO57_18335, partial [Hymenobacter sp.]